MHDNFKNEFIKDFKVCIYLHICGEFFCKYKSTAFISTSVEINKFCIDKVKCKYYHYICSSCYYYFILMQ